MCRGSVFKFSCLENVVLKKLTHSREKLQGSQQGADSGGGGGERLERRKCRPFPRREGAPLSCLPIPCPPPSTQGTRETLSGVGCSAPLTGHPLVLEWARWLCVLEFSVRRTEILVL